MSRKLWAGVGALAVLALAVGLALRPGTDPVAASRAVPEAGQGGTELASLGEQKIDAEELKAKESDRIAVVVGALAGFGANIEARDDGMRIIGTGGLKGGKVDSHGDHRIAMLGAVAGIASREGVTVDGMDAAAVSYPTFQQDLARLQG